MKRIIFGKTVNNRIEVRFQKSNPIKKEAK